MEQIPISVLIERIEAMRSEKSGRFTTGEVEMFGEVLKVLRSFEKLPMDRRKETVLFIVVHVLRIFMNPDLLREFEHFFKF
jgi:hypothetical protein